MDVGRDRRFSDKDGTAGIGLGSLGISRGPAGLGASEPSVREGSRLTMVRQG